MKVVRQELTDIQKLTGDLAGIERRHYKVTTDIHENVAEHSLTVTLLAWYLHQRVESQTSLDLVIKYALAHDFVEVLAGDVSTFATQAERMQKELSEQEALSQLGLQFKYFPDLVKVMQAYQDANDQEALFVWTADKLQAIVLGRMDKWRPYRELGISRGQFEAKMDELIAKASPELRNIFIDIVEWCKETY
jgi:5'-deoxynucleotidase YfbR-like HD superfamily hydrolase